jgi:PhnB protein
MTIRNGKPDGYTTLTPFLVCSPATEAISFYASVFGARLVSKMDGPRGTVMHAELDLGEGRLQLSDPSEQFGLVPPSRQQDVASSSTCIYVADVDTVFAAAVAHGAVVREEPTTFVTGDRFASVYDPFGHRWAMMTKLDELSPDEEARRLDEWAAGQAQQA